MVICQLWGETRFIVQVFQENVLFKLVEFYLKGGLDMAGLYLKDGPEMRDILKWQTTPF